MTSQLLGHIAAADHGLRNAHVGLPLFPPWALGLPLPSPGEPATVALPVLGVLHAIRVSINWRACRAGAHAAYEAELAQQYVEVVRIARSDKGSSISPISPALEAEAQAYARRTALDRANWTFQRDLAGYLGMAWGGAVLTAPYFGTPDVLLTPGPWLVYILPHLVFGIVISALGWNADPSQPPIPPSRLDGILTPFDAVTRAGGVVGTLESVASGTPVLFALILAALSGGGGGQLIGLLGLAHPVGWTWSTAPFFAASTLVEWHDVWSALGSGVLWLATTTIASTQSNVAPDPLDALLVRPVRCLLAPDGPWSVDSARAAVLLLMAATFAWRSAVLHGIPLSDPNNKASAHDVSKVQVALDTGKSETDLSEDETKVNTPI